MATFKLTPTPLSSDTFAPFGEVISVEEKTPLMINGGTTERYDSLASFQSSSPQDRAVINLFRAQPRVLPMRISMMEKHPLGSQSFYPLSGEPYLVLVADAGTKIKPENLHLFLAGPEQGINYNRNTWHHPVLALNTTSDFLVVDRKGDGNNCDEYFFPDDIEILIKR